MRILMIGDIVGKPGRRLVCDKLPELIQREDLDFVVANAENSAAGSGITPDQYRELIDAGVNCVTLGDHIYRRREVVSILLSKNNIVKPANYPHESPGKEFSILPDRKGHSVAVISLLGRAFMKPVDCPFAAVDRVLTGIGQQARIILVDMHAEATGDKQLMGRYLDGRVSAVLGTHTHVTTADEQILPGGTAFQCDVGMTGPFNSILGRRIDRVMETTRTFNPTTFDVATGDVRISATLVEIDPATGKATAIRRIVIAEESPSHPRSPASPATENASSQ